MTVRTLSTTAIRPVSPGGVFFDVIAEGKDPIDLRCILQLNGKTLTETWQYQYFP